ncbi:hypothetical protein H0H93_010833 [Arthromyces matolae]|nr:hypothetical protein H0H93_010833 [Arthromyces matolae]
MKTPSLLSLLSFVHFALAFKLKESVIPPHNWEKHSAPPSDHKIVLRIGLPQPNFNVLENHLFEVSDPYHPRYGAHLSKQEVEAIVAPHQDSVSTVNDWLISHGVQQQDINRSSAGDWLTITLPVHLVEKMLDTKYYVWKHSDGDSIVRTTSYSLPEHLDGHIDVIQPTTMFGRPRGMRSTIIWSEEAKALPSEKNLAPIVNAATGTLVDASCNTTITVKCLQQLYNAVGLTSSAHGNSIGITGYLEEFANFQDLRSFYTEQVPRAVNSSFSVISINNGTNNQTLSAAGAEANLDVQFAFGLSDPVPVTQFTFPLSIICSNKPREPSTPQEGALRTSLILALPPIRTKTPIVMGTSSIMLMGITSVTSVGGTQGVPEIAVSRFFSGGGFSDYFDRPSYQDTAVKGYLDKLPKGLYKGLYNPGGRGIPDVAAQGDRFRIWLAGVPRSIGGTSASSPTFAGLVAVLNNALLKEGRAPLGFLNPLLYSKGLPGLNDITVGHNPGCGTNGFNVTAGWDPVTGLGTPNVGKLKEILCK